MLTRTLTAILGIPLLIFIIQKGGSLLFASLLVLSSVGLLEYCNAVNTDEKINVNPVLEALLGIFLLCLFYFESQFIVPGLILCFMLIFIHQIWNNKVYVLQGIYAFLGLFYVAFLLGHILLFEKLENGTYILWLVFIISFATDTFAYISGVNFGRHKLCPQISPKKSVEGAVGGVVGSIIATVIYGYFMNKYGYLNFPLFFYIVLSIIVSVFSQFGDLTASLIKRTFGVKDYGHIFPGHGGVLDRFDSIIFATPVVYYITYYYILLR